MMRSLFKEKGSELRIELIADPAVQEFIGEHSSALDSSMQKVEMSDIMRRRLSRSNYIFSGMKTFHELNEAFPSLLDENGNRKSFERFLNDVQKIDRTYNVNYLRAEYNFVNASAQMAAKWEQFMEDGDRYYLRYRTQRDDKVRPEHAALDRVTLPITDSFWEEFYPPNGWNCFVGETPVLTSEGWRFIKDVNKGDLVIGGSGEYRTVIGTHSKTVNEELVRIITKRTRTTCTQNHRFLTHRGWIEARCLNPGDILIQVGEISFFNKIVNAIHNAAGLCKYCLVSLKRKRKSVTPLTIDDYPKFGDKKINNVYAAKIALLEWKLYCKEVTPKCCLSLAERILQRARSFRVSSSCGKTVRNRTPFFRGLSDVHTFDGFNSVFNFLRKTFFNTSYNIIAGKVTLNKSITKVYNLSVDKDESYVIPAGIVHNCRCNVVQVLKSKYTTTPHDEAMRLGDEALQRDTKGMFRFNPGKEEKSVPDYNPYTIRKCNTCPIAKGSKSGSLAKFVPSNEVCAVCEIAHRCYADKAKSERAIERTHYLHEMKPLLTKRYSKSISDNGIIQVGFTAYGNKHIFSDTFGRSKVLTKDDLKNLDSLLANAIYDGESELTHPRNDDIQHFYYFKTSLRGHEIRLNVAKQVYNRPSGQIEIHYYLYSVNDI